MRTPAQWAISFVVVSFFAACSSDPVDQPDAATDGDADADADFEVALPVLTPCPDGWEEVPPEEEGGVTTCDPWPGSSPVVMTPCPEGWREVEDDGVVTCDPWPEGGPHECAEDEAHFPGEPGCTRIGTECPDGNWAEDLPDDGPILYVLAGAPAGGEGTQESPFGSINEALDIAEEGTIVALSKGTFDEAVRLRNGITLWGACVAETVVTCSTPSSEFGTVSVGGIDVRVRNLTIGGGRPGVLVRGAISYSITIEDTLISNARRFGLYVASGSLTGSNVIVRDTRPLESDGQKGVGLQAQDEAQVTLSRTVFERNRRSAVYAWGENTTVRLTDLLARDTLSREDDGTGGNGLTLLEGAHVEVERGVFERNREFGVGATDEGTTLVLTDVLVRDTSYRESDRFGGNGVATMLGATATFRRCVFERNSEIGVAVAFSPTSVEMWDVVVRDTRHAERDGTGGVGLQVSHGAGATVDRAVFDRNVMDGVHARDPDTTLGMANVLVRYTTGREHDGEFGRGIGVEAGAGVVVSVASIDGNCSSGIGVVDTNTTLSFTDVVVRDTRGQILDGKFGRGLEVFGGAHAEAVRSLFLRNREAGVVAGGAETTLVIADIVVGDTRSGGEEGQFGYGLLAQAGAHVYATRSLVQRNQEAGLVAADDGTEMVVEGITVEQTIEGECSESTDCPGHGDGVFVYQGATLDLTSFLVSRNARCGATVYHGELDLHDGLIADNTIGACVNAEDFDLDRLMDNVVYRDNERRLDPNFDMPVPDPAMPLEWE